MSERDRPLFLSPEALQAELADPALLVVDLSKAETYAAGHVPGAVRLDYADIVARRPPVGGLLPDDDRLAAVLSRIGLAPGRHVVAYDDEGGGRAARLLWTLDVVGHGRASVLDGDLGAWTAAGGAIEREARDPGVGECAVRAGTQGRADRAYVLARLGDPTVVLVDCRSPAEYAGADRRAERGGHIPGAVNFEWTQAIDAQAHRRLRDRATLRERFASLGVTPDREVITYCQTHHRSSHTYAVLRWLGFPRVRGYEGSWSDWGNAPDTPIEV